MNAALPLMLVVTAAAGAATPTPPQYSWKPGESYVYAVRIEAEENGLVESLAGTCVYQAQASPMEHVKLSCSGVLYPQQRARDGAPMVPDAPFRLLRVWPAAAGSPYSAPSRTTEVELDAQGNLVPGKDGKAAPRSFGELAQLIAEPLPSDGKTAWESIADGDLYLTVTEPLAPYARVRRSFGTRFPAQEKISYTVTPGAGTLAIKKHVELKTVEPEGTATPRVQWTGDGRLTFDTKAGLPRSGSFTGTLVDGTEGAPVRLPVTISYRLLEGREREWALSGSPSGGQEPTTAAEVELLLVDVTGNNRAQEMLALDRLARLRPTVQRHVTALTLEPFTADPDLFTRAAAARALGAWGTSLTLPSLVRLTLDKEHAVRWAALDALGTLADPSAAEAVAARLPFDSAQASRALAAMGPDASPVAVKYLQHPEWTVRLETCKILTAIGNKAAAPALKRATRDPNGLVARAAAQAYQVASQRP